MHSTVYWVIIIDKILIESSSELEKVEEFEFDPVKAKNKVEIFIEQTQTLAE